MTYPVLRAYLLGKASPAYTAAMLVMLSLPLLVGSLIALRRWLPATRARWLREKGRWRDGVYLLEDRLLYVRGETATIIKRSRLRALRTKQDADRFNKDGKREGKHRLLPAIGYQDDRGKQAYLAIDENRDIWWSSIAERWDDWRRTGKPPSAVEPQTTRAAIKQWLPNIIYLQLLYLTVVLAGVILFIFLADWIDPDTAFIVNGGVALIMMLGFIGIAFKLHKPLRRWFPKLNLSYEHGGGYGVLLGFFTMGSVLFVGAQGNVWWQTAFAERLPEVFLAEAMRYKGENVMLGLRDARVDQGKFGVEYGAYQPWIFSAAERESNRGPYHYVARLVSTRSPETCLYVAAVEDDPLIKTERRSSAERLLTTAPYYREPLGLGRTEKARAWQHALDDLEGSETRRCQNMMVEPIADPDALAAKDWRQLWWVILLLQLLPLVMLSIWAGFKRENRWL
ncbi:hypothetical protein CCR91_01535 [Thiorhodovibrio winogradskyi]|nr:hypothetical protein [Thiorhodovibrio winogradskyi]